MGGGEGAVIHDNGSNSKWWVAGLEPDKVYCLNCVGGQY